MDGHKKWTYTPPVHQYNGMNVQQRQKFYCFWAVFIFGISPVIGSLLAIATNFSGGPLPVDYVVSPGYIRNETVPLPLAQDYPTSCQKLSQFRLLLSAKVLSVCLYKNKTTVNIRQPGSEKEKRSHRISFSVGEWKELMRISFDIARAIAFQEIL